MFSKEFLRLCYSSRITEKYIKRASDTALLFGIGLPVAAAILGLFKIFAVYVNGYSLIEFSGMFPNLLSGIKISYKLLTNLLSLISIVPVISAVLFKITKLPFIPIIMMIDLIMGWKRTLALLTLKTSVLASLPALPQIVTLLMLIALFAYACGLIGSVILMLDYIDFSKYRKYIVANAEYGATLDEMTPGYNVQTAAGQ